MNRVDTIVLFVLDFKFDEVFLGYQPRHVSVLTDVSGTISVIIIRDLIFSGSLMMRIEMVPETSAQYRHTTRLIAREDFIKQHSSVYKSVVFAVIRLNEWHSVLYNIWVKTKQIVLCIKINKKKSHVTVVGLKNCLLY
jgi:hypothetical protein